MCRPALEEEVELVDPDYFNSYLYVEDCADAHIFACTVPAQPVAGFDLREGEYSNRTGRKQSCECTRRNGYG